jgi:hypothetical protein
MAHKSSVLTYVPKKSDFLENRISQTVPKVPKKSDFLENRISQTVPNVPKKSDFLEKSDFSNRVPKRAQEMKKKSCAQEILF